jgi:ubiquitin-like 1-activating enzyme E1 B
MQEQDEVSASTNGGMNGSTSAVEENKNGQHQQMNEEKKRLNTRQFAEQKNYEPTQLFDKLFNDDTNYLLSMADLWKERRKPVPLRFTELVSSGFYSDHHKKNQNIFIGLGGSAAPSNDSSIQWSITRWAEVFEETIMELAQRYQDASKEGRVLIWDKDDDTAMQFVAACANLRAHIFHIGTKSLFDIKGFLRK